MKRRMATMAKRAVFTSLVYFTKMFYLIKDKYKINIEKKFYFVFVFNASLTLIFSLPRNATI